MFTLNTGSYRSLEKSFLEHVLAQKKGSPLAPILVLSPSGHQLNHLQSLLAKEHPGFLNIQFLTFYALAEKLLAEGPVHEDQVITEPALFREIIQDFLEGRGEVPFISREMFRRSGPIPKGLSGALAATLKDLQDSGARVVDCANVAREGHLGEAADGAVPILELNVLMYDVLRKHGLRAGAAMIRRAAERVPQSAWIKQQKAIYLYGFYDLTGVQLDLINALASHPNLPAGRQAHVFFPYEEGNPAYGYAEILLRDPAFATKVQSPRSNVQGPGKDFGPRTLDIGRDVEAFSCSGTHDEIWLAAKKILELADAGVPYHEMAVLARTLDPYLNTVREVLEAHRIPYALHTEEPVGAYPLIKLTRQTLSHSQHADGEASWSSHVTWAEKLLDRAIVLPKDADATEKKLWEGVLATLDSLKTLDVLNRPVSHERFLDVLEDKLEGLRLPLSSDNTAGVQVMDVMTARGLPFEAVFLVGLNEKLFPRLIREDPFLSDSARSSLAQALGSRLGRKMDGYQEEKLLFDLAIKSARSHLHLSCQRSDEEGKALVISLYLHDFLHKNGIPLQPLRRTWVEKIQQVPPGTLRPKEVSLAYHRENRDTDTLYTALDWDRDLMNHLLKTQHEIESFGALGGHDGLIGKGHPMAKEILAKGLSPATLKDLAECPFKVYGRKVLSLDPDEKDVDEGVITPTGRGKIVHKILETFYQSYSESKDIDINRIAELEFKIFEREYPDLYPLAWQAERDQILSTLKRFTQIDLVELKESGFTPTLFETSLTEEVDGILLQGRIDRLDLKKDAFRVVDYKTGSGGIGRKDKVETAILKGKNFQLPVYLLLAQKWLEKQDKAARKGSAAFYKLGEGEAPLQIDTGFWKEYGSRFHNTLKFLVKKIEDGSFHIRPTDSHGYCSWCTLAAVCRKEHKPTQIRSENSPQRKKHEEAFRP